MTDTSITTYKDVYDVTEKHERGQFANVYRARRRSDGLEVAIKHAAELRHNDFLKHEHDTLTRLGGLIKPEVAFAEWTPVHHTEPWAPFIHLPLDSFVLDDRNANVFRFPTDRYSVAEVAASLGHLTHTQAAWIYQRLLVGLGYVHEHGAVHGAVLPEHVLVPQSAEGFVTLVDWCYATEEGGRLRVVDPDARSYYPPEVLNKDKVTTATDIYMATKTVLSLLNVDPFTGQLPTVVPMRLQKLMSACLETNPAARPQDAWTLAEELRTTLRYIGDPEDLEFRRLDLPSAR